MFSVREQEFFSERGFTDPIRCVACRRAHKAKRNGDAGVEPGASRRPPLPANRVPSPPAPSRPSPMETGARPAPRPAPAFPEPLDPSRDRPRREKRDRAEIDEPPAEEMPWETTSRGGSRRAPRPSRYYVEADDEDELEEEDEKFRNRKARDKRFSRRRDS